MSDLQPKIDRITNILRRDDGISGAMHYTEQISWILFLKFLNDYENNKNADAKLDGKKYDFVIDPEHRWNVWASPKGIDGKLDVKKALTGDDLTKYVNEKLFPYLKGFKNGNADLKSIRYKIGAVFEYLDNRIASGHTLREVLDIIDTLNFQNQTELFELSHIYENLLQGMGNDGGNAGEFYTPRCVIKAMVQAVDPKVGQTIYDGAAGSCGFLVESYEYMTMPEKRKNLKTNDWRTLQTNTFFGNEKTPLAYVMGMMNLILHGIESPNLFKQNSLTKDIRDIQEKDRYNVILANPPFGGKEQQQIQHNFPVPSNATELLFLQHFMKYLKVGGRAGIIVPEGVLFQTNNAFASVKKELLENFNLHVIVSLPAGVFLPYSGVKTNFILFDRTGSTSEIWYYEVNPPYKLTKNKPITSDHFQEFTELFKTRAAAENSWIVKVSDIKDYDLSAKNPNKQRDIDHLPPLDIVNIIDAKYIEVTQLFSEIKKILNENLIAAGEINWTKKHLADPAIAKLIMGQSPPSSTYNSKGVGLPFYQGKKEFGNLYPIPEVYCTSPSKIAEKDDILLSVRAPVGPTNLCPEKSCIGRGLAAIRPVTNNILTSFLLYYFKHFESELASKGQGSTFDAVTKKTLEELLIPLPQITEQKRIVDKLDRIFECIDRISNIAKMDELSSLKSSLLEAAFKGEL